MARATVLLLLLIVGIAIRGLETGVLADGGGYEAFFVLGDSLVDPGNRHLLKPTAMGLPFPLIDALHLPYGRDFPTHEPTGRFSDGFIFTDILATYMGLPYPPAYLKNTSNVLQGCSFATSGSKIMNKTGTYQFPRLNLMTQVQLFAAVRQQLVSTLGAARANELVSRSLFLSCMGANDVMSDYILNIHDRLSETLDEFIQPLTSTYTNVWEELYSLGARKFAVVSIPPLGCIPALRAVLGGGGLGYWRCLPNVNSIAATVNSALVKMVDNLQGNYPDAHIVYLNGFDITLNTVDNPVAYGFQYGLQPCCGFNEDRVVPSCFQGLNAVCLLAGQHVFWDFAHPTQAFNYVVAKLFWEGSSQHAYPMNLQQMASM